MFASTKHELGHSCQLDESEHRSCIVYGVSIAVGIYYRSSSERCDTHFIVFTVSKCLRLYFAMYRGNEDLFVIAVEPTFVQKQCGCCEGQS